MQDAQAFLGQPGVGFLSMLLIGVLAGWIAERVTESNHGIFTNILVGIAGSFVGGAPPVPVTTTTSGHSCRVATTALAGAWQVRRSNRVTLSFDAVERCEGVKQHSAAIILRLRPLHITLSSVGSAGRHRQAPPHSNKLCGHPSRRAALPYLRPPE